MAIEYATSHLKLLAVLSASGDMGGGQSAEVLVDERYSSGTGANQADKLYHDRRTLAAGVSEDIDLQTIADANGAALALAEVVVFAISAAGANGADIRVNHGATNPWTALISSSGATDEPQLDVAPGATVAVLSTADGAYHVTGTDKVINITNTDGAAAATYTITILGRSA